MGAEINKLIKSDALTNNQRETLYRRLCFIMTKRPTMIPRCYLCDPFNEIIDEKFIIYPLKVEKWMKRRGHCLKENESIKELVERVYGKEAVNIMLKLM